MITQTLTIKKKLTQQQRLKRHAIFKNSMKHQFHLVDISSLPFLTASIIGILAAQLAYFLHGGKSLNIIIFFFFLFSCLLMIWFKSVIEESGKGYHTLLVYVGLRIGMGLFIISEVLFFFAFFWAFFHVSLAPAIAIGCAWPPLSIQPLDIWGLPLTNTILLLTSGVALTLAHYDIMNINETPRNIAMSNFLVTLFLGITFLYCQFIEYRYGITFFWKENIFGSTFFVTTGFHGFHVIVGTIFLLVCFIRLVLTNKVFFGRYAILSLVELFHSTVTYFKIIEKIETLFKRLEIKTASLGSLLKHLKSLEFTKKQHLGFEAAAWYWHFVDVVWIFLFVTIYWWGSAA
jgi:heme/copper-type cytochrome/quinol oxidase subunit 3